jgi:TnpA family transposase
VPVSFLTEDQERRYGRFAGDPSPEQLARHFHLDDADHAFVAGHRGAHMRLGCAVQLGTVRFLGTFLEDPTDVPVRVVRCLAEQLDLTVDGHMAAYRASGWRWRHPIEIREAYGYRTFDAPGLSFRLTRWLYALCWTGTDRPSVLFDRATVWLIAGKVLLPGATTLERLVARVRARASERLWQRLSINVTPAQRERLEALLVVPEIGRRQSPLDRLRNGPVLTSGKELARTVRRLGEVQDLARDLPRTDRLPRSRVLALARYATASKAQAIMRLPDQRRVATLLAFVRTLEASAQDDVLDLFDVVVTRIFADAKKREEEARLRSLRDLDAAALVLRGVGAPVLPLLKQVRAAALARATPSTETAGANSTPTLAVTQADLIAAIGAVSPSEIAALATPVPEAIEAAIARVDALVRPPSRPYVDALVASHAGVTRFLPTLARTVSFGANPAGRSVMDAVDYLRGGEAARRRHPPTAFVPKAWMGDVVDENGAVDQTVWTMCLVERMRQTVRRRDLYATPALRYADPRIGLLDGAAWETARPTVCRTLERGPDGTAEVARLAERLDAVYRAAADHLPQNEAIRVIARAAAENRPDLVVTALDKLDEPESLVRLREAVAGRLPRVDLPELVLEIGARTGFIDAFTHASEAGSRLGGLGTSISAVLVAEACNTGFEPLVCPDVPALRRSRLSWVKHNYVRAETLTAANARLVAAQNGITLAQAWGGGEVASADGLRFVVPVRTMHAGPNPRYFGQGRGVTYYNLMSDQFTGLNGIVVPGTLRDSLSLLALVLEQETPLASVEIVTDTGAYTDVIFGIFWLLGFQFSPRLADIGGARFWRVDRKANYGPLDGLARHTIKPKLIVQHWDDLLRLAGSLKLGLVQASGLMRTLQTNERPTRLAQALAEAGRIVKTIYMVGFIDDEAERRRILGQLNRHEGRHTLARVVFHAKRGELRQRYREGQEDQLGALGLVVNMIVLWNTIYMDAALAQLRAEGFPVLDGDVARLSPLGFAHVNMLGRYAFSLPEAVARGELRPLRDPSQADDDTGE